MVAEAGAEEAQASPWGDSQTHMLFPAGTVARFWGIVKCPTQRWVKLYLE
jgi:hypothetical protein